MSDISMTKVGLIIGFMIAIILATVLLPEVNRNASRIALTNTTISEMVLTNNNTINTLSQSANSIFNATAKNQTFLNFSGVTTDQVSVPSESHINFNNSNYSISMWIKANSTSNYGFLVSKSSGGVNGYELFKDNNVGIIRFSACDSAGVCNAPFFDIQTTMSVTDNKWHHVVAQLERNVSARIFIDGFMNASSTGGANKTTATTDLLFIGARSGAGNFIFNGSIDEVRLYNRTLNTTEILTINASGRTANASLTNSTLGLWMSFNENQGTTTFDKSPFSNNGSFTTATYQNDGINNTLISSDYIINGNQFTLLNPIYSYSQLTINYGYNIITDTSSSIFIRLTGILFLVGVIVIFAYFINREWFE